MNWNTALLFVIIVILTFIGADSCSTVIKTTRTELTVSDIKEELKQQPEKISVSCPNPELRNKFCFYLVIEEQFFGVDAYWNLAEVIERYKGLVVFNDTGKFKMSEVYKCIREGEEVCRLGAKQDPDHLSWRVEKHCLER